MPVADTVACAKFRHRAKNPATRQRIKFMKRTMILVTDLEELKAYQVDNDPLHSSPRLDLVGQFKTDAGRKLVEQVSDQAGRFPRATVAQNIMGGMSQGERHNIELEKRKRCVRRIAGEINSLLTNSEIERCYLAASREMNKSLLDELDPKARNKITVNLPADLTKVSRSDLLDRFKAASRAGAVV